MAKREPAKFALREAFLHEPFGREMAIRYFGAKTIEELPRYKNGKLAGHYQAKIAWVKCEKPGWVSPKLIKRPGYMERRTGVVEVHLMTDEWGKQSSILKSVFVN